MSYMFWECNSLNYLNISNFNTSKVKNMYGMFYICSSLKSINLFFDTSQVEDMGFMFFKCISLISLEISNFNTSQVIKMENMFEWCTSLVSLDLFNFVTSKVQTMHRMFFSCTSLKHLNISNFITSKVETMYAMFYQCYSLSSLDVSNFDTSKVTNMDYIFGSCESLTSINVSSFNTKNLLSLEGVFSKCYALTSIDLSNFETSKVTTMEVMFRGCSKLTILYISNFNTSLVTNMDKMFYNCTNLEYINFINAKIQSNVVNMNEIISFTPSYLVICITDEILISEINGYQYPIIDCSDNWRKNKNTIEITEMILSYNLFINEIRFQKKLINISQMFNMTLELESINDETYSEVQNDQILIKFTSTNYFNNHKNDNISTINLGLCESKLKNEYNISSNDSLYILMLDIPQEGMKIPKVEYNVYYLNDESNLIQLDLTVCQNTKIEILIPVSIEENIDIYNPKSGYYNDICYTFTTNSGTDICLNDRRQEFINNNLSLCEENCELNDYDYVYKKVKCSCEIKLKIPLIEEVKFDKEKLKNNFLDISNIANIKFLKCYRIAFKIKNLIPNIGFYLMNFIILLFLIILLLFYFKFYSLFFEEIKSIFLDSKTNENHLQDIKNNMEDNIKNNQGKYNDIIIVSKKKKIKKKNKSDIIKEKNSCNFKKRKKRIKRKNSKSNIELLFPKSNFDAKDIIFENNNKIEILDFTEAELNSLSYEESLKIDKRTFIQYYISLLKLNHSIFFSFYPNRDYNSRIIKIFLFFFFISADLAVNTLFFNDDTMHQIYEDQGSFNLIYQIPQILYSSILSFILSSIIKYFSLS